MPRTVTIGGKVRYASLLKLHWREHTNHHAFLQCPCIWDGCCGWRRLQTKPPEVPAQPGPGQHVQVSHQLATGRELDGAPACLCGGVPRASPSGGSTIPRQCDCQLPIVPLCRGHRSLAASSARCGPALSLASRVLFYCGTALGHVIVESQVLPGARGSHHRPLDF